jgi:hypothetical protein
MWMTEATAETPATPEQVWSRYVAVDAWKSWDHEIESSSLQGAFTLGARGKLKPKGGPASGFVLTDVQPGRRFADRTRLPLATLHFEHELTPTASGTRITHRVRFEGLLAPLFARLIGRKIAAGLPQAVDTLARMSAGVKA